MYKNKLLIVENNINLGLLYEQELKEEGYDVLVTNSYDKALELFKQHRFDLVIIEIGKPEINELKAFVRFLQIIGNIPIIINTGYPDYRDYFMSWFAEKFVVKSSDLSELKSKIKDCLGGNLIKDNVFEVYNNHQ